MTENHPKKWYKHGWGLVAVILFLPYFIIWYVWAKSNWNKNLKIGATSAIALMALPAAIGFTTAKPTLPINQIQPQVIRQTTTDEKYTTQKGAEVKPTSTPTPLKETAAATQPTVSTTPTPTIAKTPAPTPVPTVYVAPATAATPVPTEPSSNLPLKAICNDNTISYQNTPADPDYRGMCSGHGGIKTKLGRTP